ncbi:hypothetical protein B296_00050190 [Ensete ventricosum]|uniref:Uncharacterized protein n=1 Tax=Ensete ventricosum TaxID=4639 RepID=A0A426X193_ENSVE|nr:hypothetical protein B296_00050190 [Ensete ventricosum]
MIVACLCNPWLAAAYDRHHHCFLCYRVLSDPLPLLLFSSLYHGHASTATATVDHAIATALLLHPLADVAFLLLNCNLLCSRCAILNPFPSLATVGPVLLPTSSFPRTLSSLSPLAATIVASPTTFVCCRHQHHPHRAIESCSPPSIVVPSSIIVMSSSNSAHRSPTAAYSPCSFTTATPIAPCFLSLNSIRDPLEIVYPCIPDSNGEDEGGQASSSIVVSTRWISTAKLLQSDLATLVQREGGE